MSSPNQPSGTPPSYNDTPVNRPFEISEALDYYLAEPRLQEAARQQDPASVVDLGKVAERMNMPAEYMLALAVAYHRLYRDETGVASSGEPELPKPAVMDVWIRTERTDRKWYGVLIENAVRYVHHLKPGDELSTAEIAHELSPALGLNRGSADYERRFNSLKKRVNTALEHIAAGGTIQRRRFITRPQFIAAAMKSLGITRHTPSSVIAQRLFEQGYGAVASGEITDAFSVDKPNPADPATQDADS